MGVGERDRKRDSEGGLVGWREGEWVVRGGEGERERLLMGEGRRAGDRAK